MVKKPRVAIAEKEHTKNPGESYHKQQGKDAKRRDWPFNFAHGQVCFFPGEVMGMG